MINKQLPISACLILYNNQNIVEPALQSVAGLVDEIIVVHDGQCQDHTLEIAKKYTDKIFIREHFGCASEHPGILLLNC